MKTHWIQRACIALALFALFCITAEAQNRPDIQVANPNASSLSETLGYELPSISASIQPGRGGIDCGTAEGLIIQDDGSAENGYGHRNPAPDSRIFADRYTPSTYPVTFNNVCLGFVTQAGGPSTMDFDVVVFAADGPDGTPGTLLGTQESTVTNIPIWSGATSNIAWHVVDISSLNLLIESGDVYIGAQWATYTPNVFIFADQSTDRPVAYAGGQYWDTNTNEWEPIHTSLFPSYRALFIRPQEAEVIPPQIAVTPGGLSATIATGSADWQSLTIGNTGGQLLGWSITEQLAAYAAGDADLHDTVMPFHGFSRHEQITDFEGYFAITNWTLVNAPANTGGSISTASGPPIQLTVVGGDAGQQGNTDLQIFFPIGGAMTFDWGYQSDDDDTYDSGGFVVNGAYTVLAYNNTQVPFFEQSRTVEVSAGDIFAFRVYTQDGDFGAGHLGVTNFRFTPAPNACETEDMPWLTVSPTYGSTAGGQESDVTVTFDAFGLLEGTYEGNLCIESNDPDSPLVNVPVSMTVQAPDLFVTPLTLSSAQTPDTIVERTLSITNNGSLAGIWQLMEMSDIRGDANLLYDNGPLVTHPGAGAGGADISRVQNSLGMDLFGAGAQASVGNRVADDFRVIDPAGWDIDTVTFYAYQTESATTSTITAVNLRIWDGPPGNPESTIIFGDDTTNRLVSTQWVNLYRDSEDSPNITTRPVMEVVANIGTFLPMGNYWLDWQLDGSLASGPWVPPVTILGETSPPGANARQFTSGSGIWFAHNDSGYPTAFPFGIYGTWATCGESADYPWLSLSSTAGTTNPGQTSNVTVSFDSNGLAPGEYEGRLCLITNDPASPLIEIPVFLSVGDALPVASVNPTELSFTVVAGQSASQTLTLSNLGEEDALDLIYSINVDSGGVITVDPANGSIAAGESEDLVVHVDATDLTPGPHSYDILIATNDPDNAELVVAVTVTVSSSTDVDGNTLAFDLLPSYPNPFSGVTTIGFELPTTEHVSIEVIDLTGRRIVLLVDEQVSAGRHEVRWNANGLASGVYLYRMQAGSFTKTLRTMLVQ